MAGNSTECGRSVISKFAAIVTTFTAGPSLSLTEVANHTGLATSTAHRLLQVLVSVDLLERDDHGEYRAGRVLRNVETKPTRPTLFGRGAFVVDDLAEALRTTARLGVLDDLAVTYIEKVPRAMPGTAFPNGARLPAHATAIGKALLAFIHPHVAQRVVAQNMTAYTQCTLVRNEELQHALRRTRARGFAVSAGELFPDLRTVAVPVLDSTRAAVAALEVQVADIRPPTLANVLPSLSVAARGLSREIASAPTSRSRAKDWGESTLTAKRLATTS
jgi:DNA-binding IclR family transcriptional regulator